MRTLRAKLTYGNVVSTLALFVALGGTSYAAFSLPRNSVGATQIRTHAVSGSKLRASAVTSRSIRNRSIELVDISPFTRDLLRSQSGPGPAGPAGPPGQSALTYRAAVNSGGGTPRGNAEGASHNGASNEYTIFFERSVDACVATATLAAVQNGPNLEEPPPGRITVAHLDGKIRVRTYDAAGNPAALPFNVIVAC